MSTRRIRNWWWVDFRANHTRYRVRSPENSQAAAKAYEAVLRRRLAAGEPLNPAPPPPPSPTFTEFSAQWFDTYVRTNNKPSVQESEARTLRIHLVPFFGRKRIDAIEVIDIEHYKAEKLAAGLKAKTINNHLGILAKCLATAVEWKRSRILVRTKRLRTPPPPFKFLSPDESRRLLAAWKSSEWQTVAQIALHTGLRLGELFGLRWQDIDFENRQLTVRQSIVNGVVGVPKNYRERTIPLTADAIVALVALPRRGELAFTRGNGNALSRGMAQNAIKHACRRAGIQQVGWHTLRHTFASHLAAAGTPITSIQVLLGHANITMTMRYTHTSPSALRDAVANLESRRPIQPSPDSWATGGQHSPILIANSR
jgi:integrase